MVGTQIQSFGKLSLVGSSCQKVKANLASETVRRLQGELIAANWYEI